MMRPNTATPALSILLALSAALGLYIITFETRQIRAEAQRTAREIVTLETEIALLEAELAYLKRPERIERLVRKHLDLRPLEPRQVQQP